MTSESENPIFSTFRLAGQTFTPGVWGRTAWFQKSSSMFICVIFPTETYWSLTLIKFTCIYYATLCYLVLFFSVYLFIFLCTTGPLLELRIYSTEQCFFFFCVCVKLIFEATPCTLKNKCCTCCISEEAVALATMFALVMFRRHTDTSSGLQKQIRLSTDHLVVPGEYRDLTWSTLTDESSPERLLLAAK